MCGKGKNHALWPIFAGNARFEVPHLGATVYNGGRGSDWSYVKSRSPQAVSIVATSDNLYLYIYIFFSFTADRQQVRLIWDKWELFLEMKQKKGRMLEHALWQKRRTTLK